MQLHGWDVDVLNSVQFSNHTGYASFEGERLSGQQVLLLLKGLQDNALLSSVQYLLTGYVGSETFLSAMLQVWQQLRHYNPQARYVCDPVLGDQGRFYVPESLVQVYREQVIPQATIVTPNAFELEQLTGCEKITTLEMAQQQCQVLHNMGPSIVFLTSFQPLGENVMVILASQRTSETSTQCWKLECPVLPGSFTGTGDLCAALILVHSANHPNDVATVLEKVVNTVYAVLEKTLEYADNDPTVKARELRLIQSKHVIEHPPQRFRAVLL
jgi:pyridoxine kinase